MYIYETKYVDVLQLNYYIFSTTVTSKLLCTSITVIYKYTWYIIHLIVSIIKLHALSKRFILSCDPRCLITKIYVAWQISNHWSKAMLSTQWDIVYSLILPAHYFSGRKRMIIYNLKRCGTCFGSSSSISTRKLINV